MATLRPNDNDSDIIMKMLRGNIRDIVIFPFFYSFIFWPFIGSIFAYDLIIFAYSIFIIVLSVISKSTKNHAKPKNPAAAG
jgi:hypothetical protein